MPGKDFFVEQIDAANQKGDIDPFPTSTGPAAFGKYRLLLIEGIQRQAGVLFHNVQHCRRAVAVDVGAKKDLIQRRDQAGCSMSIGQHG